MAPIAMRRLSKKRLNFAILALIYLFGTYTVTQFSHWTKTQDLSSSRNIEYGPPLRKLLWKSTGNYTPANESKHRCIEPSVKEFPQDIFTQQQRRYGAVLLHIFMALYMFTALAFVCDDYFISCLDKICERLDLTEDVAGATFMAAGSSAPELFTSIIGVFIAKGDVGVGTIVGSAVFNILVIIALCGLFAGQVVHLTWWPLCRDSLYYCLAISSLIWTIYDGVVTWYESLIMLLLYFGYILLMKFNPVIIKYINSRSARKNALLSRENADSDTKLYSDPVAAATSSNVCATAQSVKTPADVDVNDCLEVKYTQDVKGNFEKIELIEERRRITWKELGMMIMLTDQFSPTTRFRAACLIVIQRADHKKGSSSHGTPVKEETGDPSRPQKNGTVPASEVSEEEYEEESDIEGKPFLYPQGSVIRILFWVLSLPIITVLYFTIPDCRKPKWAAWYLLTFFASLFWIVVFSYMMVWMVCVIGFTLGIPDVIMGITFLAAGTSIPDAISSLLVAREGLGDMAVSNSIGSNVFDILIGLAVPWLIKTAFVKPGQKVIINSRGMVYSVALLFASVIVTVLVIHCNKWRLDKKLGFTFILIYALFLTLSACIEFNVFGFVNFPSCKYTG